MAGCSSSSSEPASSPTVSTDSDLNEIFIEFTLNLTPDISTAAVSSWDSWRGDTDFTVFKKLFHPDSGWEGVMGPLQGVDDILGIVQESESFWSEAGTQTITLSEGTQTMTFDVTVEDLTEGMQVPYFNVTETNVSKQVTMISSDGSMKIRVAFSIDGEEKAMVCHSFFDQGEQTEYVVFRGNYNESTTDINIWLAGVSDKATDDFKICFNWQGNEDNDTFAITQYTNAAKHPDSSDGFWKVLGGGSISNMMAIRANNRDAETEDYFVVTDLEGITGTTAPDGFPQEASLIDSVTNPVQGYIDPQHANCLGWLTGFPEAADLSWTYDE